MKKIFTLALSTLLALPALHADNDNDIQLPNNGFDEDWVAATPYNSENYTKSSFTGTNPASWCISHVLGLCNGYLKGTGSLVTGTSVDGYNGSRYAAKVFNYHTGIGTLIRQVPGYLTLGTTWSTSKGTYSISNTDGGTFGGYDFTGRPDAMTVMYQRSHGDGSSNTNSNIDFDETEPATFVIYLWNGTFKQANVPASINTGDATQITMINRDRCVLGKSLEGCQGGEITEYGTLIASAESSITGDTSGWTSYLMELNYTDASSDTKLTPEKINVIFSANDYFNISAKSGENNTLIVDDVKLLYYSQLTDLQVNGTTVSGFAENVDSYTIPYTGFSSLLPADASAFTYTRKGQSRTSEVSIDIDRKVNHRATVKVTNAEGTDAEGLREHTYVIQFPTPYYSQLTSLSVNGVAVPDFAEDTYNYTLSGYVPATADAFTYTTKVGSGTPTVDVAIDRAACKATITVKNAEGVDYDNVSPTPIPCNSTPPTSVAGEAVAGFAEDVYSYNVDGYLPTDVADFTYTLKAGSGTPTVDIALDAVNYKATITVTNNGGVDYDGLSTHTYTLQFKTPYYSQLASLKVNGEDVEDFAEDTYEYTVYGDLPVDVSAFAYTLKQGGGGNPTASIALDSTAKTATITVSNPDGVDPEGLSSHVYTITFAEVPEQIEEIITYEGSLTIEMLGADISPDANAKFYVHVIPEGGINKCTFVLPNFKLENVNEGTLGDIIIEKVTYAKNGDYITYKGQKENLILTPRVDETETSIAPKDDEEEGIVADCYLDGEQTSDSKAHFKIDVYWKVDGAQIPINVEFNGLINTGVKAVAADNDENAPVEYYNLQGIRIAYPQAGQIVIRRQGSNVSKIKL